MPNSYFQFKQFTISQDECAMKVGTLGCILGAYAFHTTPNRVLDIGTGTGLLALMLAQRFSKAKVDAIEIEAGAFRQAVSNVNKSTWSDRINIIHEDFLQYDSEPYDLIVSNPPFFENNLKSPDRKINLARHSDHLPARKFLEKAVLLLKDDGVFYILLPPFEMNKIEKLASEINLLTIRKLNILNFPDQQPKACVFAFSKTASESSEECLAIRNNDNTYTKEFISLLKAFYLHF